MWQILCNSLFCSYYFAFIVLSKLEAYWLISKVIMCLFFSMLPTNCCGADILDGYCYTGAIGLIDWIMLLGSSFGI
jgi:hypothetical protein